jgi:hypothetical protein
MSSKYYDTKGAVEFLGKLGITFKPITLEIWRSKKQGPRFIKVARKVFYEEGDLIRFIIGDTQGKVDSAAE